METTIVTATSQLDSTVFDTATDITTVIIGEVRYNIYLPLTLKNY